MEGSGCNSATEEFVKLLLRHDSAPQEQGLECKHSNQLSSPEIISVTIARFLRRGTLRRSPSHLAIVVLPDEATAFQAYRLLQYHGISPENLAIVGEGYSSPERVGLMKPTQIAVRTARRLGTNAAVFGAIVCFVLSLFWQVEANLIQVMLLTGFLSGICGAIVGALIGLLGEGSAASIYRHHLNQGRYLLMMEGPENLVRWGQEVLNHYSAPSPH